jgi:hypothetical protein
MRFREGLGACRRKPNTPGPLAFSCKGGDIRGNNHWREGCSAGLLPSPDFATAACVWHLDRLLVALEELLEVLDVKGYRWKGRRRTILASQAIELDEINT